MATAKVTFLLSEAGQRAALAQGIDAARSQSMEVEVSNADLELFDISADGSLSASAQSGSEISWGTSFENHYFDAPPSPEDLLIFLRERKIKREQVLAEKAAADAAAEAARQQEQQAKVEAFLAKIRAENEAGTLNLSYSPGNSWISNPTGPNPPSDHPEVIAYMARANAAAKVASEATARRKAINAAAPSPTVRKVEQQESGEYAYTVPSSGMDKSWAKLLTGVDVRAKGGYAWEGHWIDCGATRCDVGGTVIVVGGKEWQGSRKHGSWEHSTDVYVITPVGVILVKDEKPVDVKKLYNKSSEERITYALEYRAKRAEEYLAALAKLDPTEFAAEEAVIGARILAWEQVKADCIRLIETQAQHIIAA